MPEYLKRSFFFSKFTAEGTIPYDNKIERILQGHLNRERIPHALGLLAINIEQSTMHNGDRYFRSTEAETGQFVIRSLEFITKKLVTPDDPQPKITTTHHLKAYGQFIHHNPSGYTIEDLAYGAKLHDGGAVEYDPACLSIEGYPPKATAVPVHISLMDSMPATD